MKNLILIHGALGSPTEFDAIAPQLEKYYKVHTYAIPHHTAGDEKSPFEIQALAENFLQFLENIGTSYIYGFSLGGYIALSAALMDATNFMGIVTQGTKFNWNKEDAAKEIERMQVRFLKENSVAFYDYLVDLHGEYLPELITKTSEFLLKLGSAPLLTNSNLSELTIPVRITRGGKDKMVTQEESERAANTLSNGQYFEVPHLIHPLGFISSKSMVRHIHTQIESLSYRFVETSHGKMAYRQYGEIKNQETPIVLFLHEAIGSIAQWQNFPQELSDSLLLPGIAIEFPGYGFSAPEHKERDERYLHEFALEYLPEFLAQATIKNPLFIVGHSDGGTNALLYAAKFPNNVIGIVTLAAHYKNEVETRAGIQPAVEAYQAGKLKGLEFFHGEKTERLFYAWANTWNTARFKQWNIAKDIQNCSVPALIIQGDNDQYGTDQQVNGIVDLLDNATSYFIKECGHAPHLEKQRAVILAICQFYFTLD